MASNPSESASIEIVTPWPRFPSMYQGAPGLSRRIASRESPEASKPGAPRLIQTVHASSIRCPSQSFRKSAPSRSFRFTDHRSRL